MLRGLPGVLDVAVIGVEDRKAGQVGSPLALCSETTITLPQVPRAYIVRQDTSLTQDMVSQIISLY